MSNPGSEFRPSGMIEFEAVEPASTANAAEAKPKADDGGLDLDPLSVQFGRPKDSRATQADRMLQGTTIDWLVAFPPELRPKALCERYPFVANRLAQHWSDRMASATSLELLAADERWGTVGYPAQIQLELQRLLRHVSGGRSRSSN